MTTPHHNPHEAEAQARWGHTDAWRQSRERVAKLSKEEMAAITAESDMITKQIATAAAQGKSASDADVQLLIAKHYAWLSHFYDPSLEMYRGLGTMYADDPRFAAHYETYGPNLGAFLRDAIHVFCQESGSRESRP